MPKLELTSVVDAETPELSSLAIGGGLDIATLSELEAHLDDLKKQGRLKVIVDLKNLSFISSSGLGVFLGTVNHFRKGGGDLAFLNLSPKIQKIFSMVGFMRVLTVLGSREEAVDYFSGPKSPVAATRFAMTVQRETPHSGEAFHLNVQALDAKGQAVGDYSGSPFLKPDIGIVSPAQIGPFVQGRWSGEVILTGPGELILDLQDAHEPRLDGKLRLVVQETKPYASFPMKAACPGCQQLALANASEVLRCKQCGEILLVDLWGHSISLRRGLGKVLPPRVFQMLVPSDVNCLAHVRNFVTGLLKEEGFSEDFANDVELAVEEALANVVEHAYEYDATQTLALRVSAEKDSVSILIRDTGKIFDRKSLPMLDLDTHLKEHKAGGLGHYLMETLMDKVEYKSGTEGNTLLMQKVVKSKI